MMLLRNAKHTLIVDTDSSRITCTTRQSSAWCGHGMAAGIVLPCCEHRTTSAPPAAPAGKLLLFLLQTLLLLLQLNSQDSASWM